MKKIIRKFLHMLGYEIRRTPSGVQIEPRPTGVERDAEGYDRVWSDEAFVAQYRTDHLERCQKIIHRLAELSVMDDVASVADIGCGPGTVLALLAKCHRAG